MLKPGLRVVRGPNWCWANQDSGEGHVGTVRDINLPGTPDKTVVVQWDNGSQLNCRVGFKDKYDLRVIDNAQIGVRHRHICDGCDKKITGMRYHCLCCFDYDLCYRCYHGDKHDLTHTFKRFDGPHSLGISLPPRLYARKCELRGIFKGAKVGRGFDWEWDNQDGGQGKFGIVQDIRGWEHKSDRSTAKVNWPNGNTDVYRIGHKGFCDIQFVESSSGGEYYPEHLPILGQREEEMEWNGILDAIDRQQIMQLERGRPSKVGQQDPTLASLSPVESKYASIIMEYNHTINTRPVQKCNEIVSTVSQQMDLLDKFLNASVDIKDEEIKEMWEMLKYMTKLPVISHSEDKLQVRNSEAFIKVLIAQGKKFLEDRYKTYMEDIVKGNTTELPQGDTPGLYPLVHNFVSVRFRGEYCGFQDGTVDNRPLWPMVYYCLRTGDIPAAIHCLRETTLPEFKEIISILNLKLNDPNNPEIDILEENIRFLYRSVVRNCTDPFKRIIWAVLGCYNEISEAARTADDYLWFKLNLARFDCNNAGYIRYEDLQYTILEEQGESHYDAINRPCLYFKLLLLTGQFEAATEFLYRTDKFRLHGVHMSIALNELNLLVAPQDVNSSLISIDTSDPKPARRLNLVLLIKNYVSNFENKCLNGALNYYFLLRNFSDAEGKNLFEVCAADLAVKTKEYVKILGKLDRSNTLRKDQSSMCRTNGLIDQFNIADMFRNVVTEMKSQILAIDENWEELVKFYDTVNDQESVLYFMCTMLSKVAHLEGQPDSLRNKVQEKALHIRTQYTLSGYTGHQGIYASFMKAQGLLVFFDQYRAKRYSEALRTLSELQIVPLNLAHFERLISSFSMLNEDLVKVIPDVLLATMAILVNQCDAIKKSDVPNQQHLRWVWEQANTVTNFAERLPKAQFESTLNKLVQMEILMHS